MRNFALNQALSTGNAGTAPLNLVRNFFNRRRVRKLLASDSRTLASVGLTHADVARALCLPLSDNPLLALEQMAFHRMR